MKCLNKFLGFLKGSLKEKDDFDPSLILDEPLARFLLDKHKRYFDEKRSLVKPPAFNPSRKTNDLSVYRTKNCSEERVWNIADNSL